MFIFNYQNNLVRSIVEQFELRQHELIRENRELRDLVHQFICRLIRFRNVLDLHCLCASSKLDQKSLFDQDCDSLDEVDDDDDGGDDIDEINEGNRLKLSKDDKSLMLENVSEFLMLELPYNLIRDRLIRRTHFICRLVWISIKKVAMKCKNLKMENCDLDEDVNENLTEYLNIVLPKTNSTFLDETNVPHSLSFHI